MKSKKPAVALIFGGAGKEHSVSLSGAPYLFSLIDKEKFSVIPLLIKQNGIMVSASISESGAITEDDTAAHLFRMFGKGGVIIDGDFIPISVAIPLLHGDFGEDGTVQGALCTVGIPYVGCDGSAGSLCLDKIFTKILAEHLGIPVAKYAYLVLDGKEEGFSDAACAIEARLGYPVIIKPARLGSSVGISTAEGREELLSALRRAYLSGGERILAEELLQVRAEAECACLLLKDLRLFSSPGSVRAVRGIYDYEKKYISPGGVSISASGDFSPEETALIKQYSASLADLLGLRHLSRIDFFVTQDGRVIFNEINTFPGFTRDSLYPKLILSSGIEPKDAINRMLCEVAGL